MKRDINMQICILHYYTLLGRDQYVSSGNIHRCSRTMMLNVHLWGSGWRDGRLASIQSSKLPQGNHLSFFSGKEGSHLQDQMLQCYTSVCFLTLQLCSHCILRTTWAFLAHGHGAELKAAHMEWQCKSLRLACGLNSSVFLQGCACAGCGGNEFHHYAYLINGGARYLLKL